MEGKFTESEMIENDEYNAEIGNRNSQEGTWDSLLELGYILVLLEQKEAEEEWDEARRFHFENTKLAQILRDAEKLVTSFIEPGQILFRAREFTDSDYLKKERYAKISKIIKENAGDYLSDRSIVIDSNRARVIMDYVNFKTEIKEQINNLPVDDSPFKGFDAKGSDAAPPNAAVAGRINPRGVRYLYASYTEDTALGEMRPLRGQRFSVCEIRIKDSIKVFDLTIGVKEDSYCDAKTLRDTIMLRFISDEFSKPNYGSKEDYFFTQQIASYIKRLGYEGIKYRSALTNDGVNVVLFNTQGRNKKYEILNSKLYTVDEVKVNKIPLSV